MNRTDSTCSNVSPPQAPAFIRSAPPRQPGMPSRNSSPARPASRAELAMWFRRAPAPQCKTFSRTSICANPLCRKQITIPRIPPSRITRFEPRPSRNTGTSCVAAYRIVAAKSVSLAGVTKTSAAPPTPSVVRLASGSFSSTSLSVLTNSRNACA